MRRTLSVMLKLSLSLTACGAPSELPADEDLPDSLVEPVTGRPAADPPDAATSVPRVLRDVVYVRRPGVDVTLTSLDVHRVARPRAPAIVFVHGGGWRSGDKANLETSGAHEALLDRGYSVVSINVRLVGDPRSADATPREQAADVAAALAWVHAHADEVGIDPGALHLLGYSSGAHLVALVGTDARLLEQVGLRPDAVATISPIDVIAYDIPWAIANACAEGFCDAARNLPLIFGDDEARQRAASPLTYVDGRRRPQPFFIVSAGEKEHQPQTLSHAQSERLKAALQGAEGVAWHHHEGGLDHTELMTALATPGEVLHEAFFVFLGDPSSSGSTPPPDTCARMQAELSAAFAEETRALTGPGGVVAAVRSRCGAISFAAGRTGRDPLTPEHRVRIGSVSKTYTAAAVLRAVERGQLRLDAPVSTYLPRFPGGARITVAQLLDHTSGLADIVDDAAFMRAAREDPSRVWTWPELLNVAAALEPDFAPGASWGYSNTNFLLLGVIAERALGVPFERGLAELVLEPAGLTGTVFEARTPAPGLARGYGPTGADATEALHPSIRWAAGSIAAPIAEVAAWGEALYATDLLSAPTRQRMLAGTETGGAGRYGLGVFISEDPALGTLVGHGGAAPGYHCLLQHAVEGGQTVAVTSTFDAEVVAPLTSRLLSVANR